MKLSHNQRVLTQIFLIFISFHSFAQAPTLQSVTTSGNQTSNPLILNRLIQTDLSPQFMIIGRKTQESSVMKDVYVMGYSNKLIGNVSMVTMLGAENIVYTSNAYVFGKKNHVYAGNNSGAIGYDNTLSSNVISSYAIGALNRASSPYSSAFGRNNVVSGYASVAMGNQNQVSGENASGFGQWNISTGLESSALGIKNTSPGKGSVAIGNSNSSSGEMSVSIGYTNLASSYNAIALGKDNRAQGSIAIAIGKGNQATAANAFALGIGSVASGINSFSIGRVVNPIGGSLKIGPSPTSYVFINDVGNVSIGTTDAKGHKLAVAGKVIAEEIKVKLQGNWPDYVFNAGYSLMPLAQLEAFINTKGHLPNVPSAREVAENGIELGEMNKVLLRKVEELTLHLIELNKQLIKQQEEIVRLNKNNFIHSAKIK